MTAFRIRNWDVALVAWARDVRGQKYRWGVTDCGTLARNAVGVLYGVDPLAGGSWDGPSAARRWLRAVGGPESVMGRLRAEEVSRPFAQAGDIAVLPGDHEGLPRFAVVVNASTALVSNVEDGVHLVPVARLDPDGAFWRLPA